MPTRRSTYRFVVFAFAALAATGLPSCGGGSDGGGTSNPVATFTPDTPNPGNGSVAMLAGSSSGASVNVRITMTGVDNVFGAAFRVTYDPSALFFNGMDDSGSLLRQGGVAASSLFFEANQSSVVGEVIITATRLDPSVVPTVDVAATADLVVLNFNARRAIASGDAGGLLAFDLARQVKVCADAPPHVCTDATLTWSGGAVTAQ